MNNFLAFFAGLGIAGIVSYFYPRLNDSMSRQDSGRISAENRGSNPDFVDLNEASAEELQELPGIGPALSERIIENRPYRYKLELISRMVIPEAAYERIKDLIDVSDDSTEVPIQVAL